MDTLSCIIIDDEPLARDVLKNYIGSLRVLNLKGEFRNALDANIFLLTNKVDLLLIDINMPHISGIEFIKQYQNPPAVVFTTAYTKYAIDGFELDAVDYLVKPITLQRFTIAINKVMKRLGMANSAESENRMDENIIQASNRSFLFLKEKDRLVKVYLDEIIAIESIGHYVKIYTPAKNHTIHQSISDLELRLPVTGFIRSHRSFIVNVSYIKSYTRQTLETEKLSIPIGRSFKNDVFKLLDAGE